MIQQGTRVSVTNADAQGVVTGIEQPWLPSGDESYLYEVKLDDGRVAYATETQIVKFWWDEELVREQLPEVMVRGTDGVIRKGRLDRNKSGDQRFLGLSIEVVSGIWSHCEVHPTTVASCLNRNRPILW